MAVSPASAYADTRAPHPRRAGASTSAHSSHDALVDGLDATLRELVRREGVDPQRDADVVRRLAEGVVRRHDDHSLTGAVAPLADPDAVVGELLARVSGFGPLQPLLEDPTVEEIWINDPTRVFVARRGRHELTNLVLTRAQVDELVERMLKSSGRRIDLFAVGTGPDGVDPYAAGDSGSFWPKILGLGSVFYAVPYDENITIGIGVFSPGGGNINYKSNWSGAYQVDAIALELVNINPSVAVRFDDKHSIGFGVSVVGGHLRYRTQLDAKGLQPYLLQELLGDVTVDTLTVTPQVQNIVNNVCDIKLLVDVLCGIRVGDVLPRPIIDALSSPLADALVDPSSTASGLIEMYGYGLGYNLGYMFGINEKSRVGLSFRSATKVNLRGGG